jgi:NADH-quinone oxidoreductase subunit J
MSQLFFYIFAAIAIAGALGMVMNTRNTVAAALSLVLTMVALGGVYVLLEAYLIGALQILVYAGAILVLFLRREVYSPQRQRATKIAGAVIGLLVLVQFLQLIHGAFGAPAAIPEGFGGYRQVGTVLFTDYVLAFEATSLLLLAAMVGAVILAKRKID